MPKRRRASCCFTAGFKPSSSIVPLVGLSSVVSILIVVVFPAPFGPRKAKISPCCTSKEMPFTAVKSPKVFTRFSARIIDTVLYIPNTERFSFIMSTELRPNPREFDRNSTSRSDILSKEKHNEETRMATANPAITASPAVYESRKSNIPWYLWCAALAVTSVTIGAHWDVSWHRSIGRDTFWTPAHLAIYACGVLAGICCGYLILNTTFRRSPELLASSVSVFGFRAPLGAFLAAWGGVAMLTSAPFDNWWHNAYGLDVKIISPPHTLLMLGIFAVDIGAFFLIAAAMNRADGVLLKKLQWLLLYLGGLMVVLTMFFRMEYTWDIRLHTAAAYISVAIGLPTYLAMFWECSRQRWT